MLIVRDWNHMSMKLLVISDIHGRQKVVDWTNTRIKKYDIDAVLILGDITQFGPMSWAEEFLKSLDAPGYAIPGNCDPPATTQFIEKGGTSLHGKKVELGGYTLIGVGGSNPTIFETPNEMSEEEICDLVSPLMEREVVLVSHAPPYGVNDVPPSGSHTGSTCLRDLVDEFEPRAVLSGHIHEARGVVREGSTVFMNPGAAKDGYAGIMELNSEIRMELLDTGD